MFGIPFTKNFIGRDGEKGRIQEMLEESQSVLHAGLTSYYRPVIPTHALVDLGLPNHS